MKWPKVRVGLPAKHHLQQMSRIMTKPVDVGPPGLQPTGEHIDGQWESIHFGEQGHQKCAKSAKGTPVPTGLRLKKTEGENDKYG